MINKILALSLSLILILSFSACSFSSEPEALSGVAPATVDVQPTPVTTADSFMYDGSLSLADSFNQMNSLRLSICDDMFSAVVNFGNDSAWVPIAANKYTLGSDEFLAASYVMEMEPSITAKKLMREEGFKNIEISPLDIENTFKITATKEENGVLKNYLYTIMYGSQSDSYRFTLTIDDIPTMMLASRRITGGYAVQVWTPEGSYHILAQDVREGRFGYIPRSANDTSTDFPENDIYFDDSLVTSTFTTSGADYTFLLANSILYIARDGANYAIPLR